MPAYTTGEHGHVCSWGGHEAGEEVVRGLECCQCDGWADEEVGGGEKQQEKEGQGAAGRCEWQKHHARLLR